MGWPPWSCTPVCSTSTEARSLAPRALDVAAAHDLGRDDRVGEPLLAPRRGDYDLVEGERQRAQHEPDAVAVGRDDPLERRVADRAQTERRRRPAPPQPGDAGRVGAREHAAVRLKQRRVGHGAAGVVGDEHDERARGGGLRGERGGDGEQRRGAGEATERAAHGQSAICS